MAVSAFLIDKIIEFAPRWLYTICDNANDDWGDEEQLQITEDEPITSSVTDDTFSVTNNLPSFVIPSATGMLIDATNTEQVPLTDKIIQSDISLKNHQLGYLSRFLILALDQLQSKHELRRTTINGIYVTKHELCTVNVNSFLIRKVYITPSTILYEGPYREEKCPVTRHFVKEQDGFLRITFRDEG